MSSISGRSVSFICSNLFNASNWLDAEGFERGQKGVLAQKKPGRVCQAFEVFLIVLLCN